MQFVRMYFYRLSEVLMETEQVSYFLKVLLFTSLSYYIIFMLQAIKFIIQTNTGELTVAMEQSL